MVDFHIRRNLLVEAVVGCCSHMVLHSAGDFGILVVARTIVVVEDNHRSLVEVGSLGIVVEDLRTAAAEDILHVAALRSLVALERTTC